MAEPIRFKFNQTYKNKISIGDKVNHDEKGQCNENTAFNKKVPDYQIMTLIPTLFPSI